MSAVIIWLVSLIMQIFICIFTTGRIFFSVTQSFKRLYACARAYHLHLRIFCRIFFVSLDNLNENLTNFLETLKSFKIVIKIKPYKCSKYQKTIQFNKKVRFLTKSLRTIEKPYNSLTLIKNCKVFKLAFNYIFSVKIKTQKSKFS